MAPATTGCTTQPLLTTNLTNDPRDTGWYYSCPPEGDTHPAPTGSWEPPDAAGEPGRLVASTGHWASPEIPVEPLHYYRVDAGVKARGGEFVGFIWIVFEEGRGLSLPPDNCTGLDATDGWATQTMCFRAPARAARATVRVHALEGSHVQVSRLVVEEVAAPGVRAWIEELNGTLDPDDHRPSPGRLDLLPRTAAALASGGTMRVVMLGDSIMNDTANSLYETSIERAYEGSHVDVIASVSGGGGCWRYKEAVREWVLDHEPDLLMIGGISSRDDLDAVRSVVEQTRADSSAEVMLLTGPAGDKGDPATNPDWASHVSLTGDGFHARLKRLAGEMRCEFVDLATPWGEHVRSSGKPYAHFMRDAVHPNTRGKLVLGRLLASHLSPKA